MTFSSKGQTLIEVLIVVTIGVLILGALVFVTISSLRNAQFAKNQSQATKLAQEGIEKVRSIRDRGGQNSITGNFTIDGYTVDSWMDDDLWGQISHTCPSPVNCYFKLSGTNLQFIGAETSIPSIAEDPLGDTKFNRVVILSDDTYYRDQKTVTVIVRWNDFAGDHQSVLTTILRRI